MKQIRKFYVKSGRLITYYPFKIKGKKNIDKIRKRIQESRLVISEIFEIDKGNILWFKEEYIADLEEKERNTLAYLIENPKDGELASFFNNKNFKVRLPENLIGDTKNVLQKEDQMIDIGIESYDKLNIRIESISKNNLMNYLERIDNKIYLSKKIYGVDVMDYYTEYLLQPIYVKNRYGNNISIPLSLQIYENGSVIFKVEEPIVNSDLKKLYDDYSLLYKEIKLSKYIVGGSNEYNMIQTHDISDAIGIYVKIMCEITRIDLLQFARFNHIMFTECSPQIRDFGNMSNKMYETIYRVLAAPIPEQKNIHNEMRPYCEENYWGGNGVRYYFGKTGKCISIIDKKQREFVEKKEKNMDGNVENKLHEIMEFNIEYCINILLLEYINGKGRYRNNLRGKDIDNIKKEYCETKLMILEMKEYCFASVLELLDQMEKSMKYYLKKELIDLKNENIEKIFYIQERKKKAAQKKIIEIAGFMYTLVFGLTAIYETIDVLNKTFQTVDKVHDKCRGFFSY